jgi:surface antigen
MRFGRVGAIALAAICLTGCADATRSGLGPTDSLGTFFGTITGSTAGSQPTRGDAFAPTTTASNSAIGALIGNRIGAALDDEDRARAYEAQIAALETGSPGAPTGWRNAESGRHGTIVPGPAYQRNTMTCRQYTHTVYIDGKPQVARGTACRNPDGTWTAIT